MFDIQGFPLTIIHGCAKGADSIAGRVAEKNGWSVEEYPADWNYYGNGAGIIRNRQMLKKGKPDLVLAFWDGKSRGTANMIELAERAGVTVKVIRA